MPEYNATTSTLVTDSENVESLGSLYEGSFSPLGETPPPTVYYRMRGIDTTCPPAQQPAYVYWTVENDPDFTAAHLDPLDLPCGSDPLTDVVDIQIAASWW